MEDPGAIEPGPACGVEAVPLDEKEIQRTPRGFPQSVADRPSSLEFGRWSMGVDAP